MRKKATIKEAFWSKKNQADNICKQPHEGWTVKEVATLITYK
jgi:hypothetical protein